MTTTDQHRNFLGIPIEGDITRGERRVAQRPLSDLAPLIRAVLDDPTMHSFGWTQYTPYFNDGDACIFSVGEPWFKTVDDARKAGQLDENEEGYAWLGKEHGEGEDDEEDDDTDYDDLDSFTLTTYGDGHPSLGKREGTGWAAEPGAYVGPDEARYDRVYALNTAINSGAFEDVFLEAFGDHCSVVVTATGITVDEYSHD